MTNEFINEQKTHTSMVSRTAPTASARRGKTPDGETVTTAQAVRRHPRADPAGRAGGPATSSASGNPTRPRCRCPHRRRDQRRRSRSPPDHAVDRGERAVHRRPGPAVPADSDGRHRQRQPTCRDHRRPRLLHRLLPAVRLRPGRLRPALRRQARPAAGGQRQPAGQLGVTVPAARSRTPLSFPGPSRSRSGWAPAATPARPSARDRPACRSPTASSAARRTLGPDGRALPAGRPAAGADDSTWRSRSPATASSAATGAAAKDLFFRHEQAAYAASFGRLPARSWPERSRLTPRRHGIFAGDPEEIADRIIDLQHHLGHSRHFLQMDIGGMPQPEVLKSIELLGTEVAGCAPSWPTRSRTEARVNAASPGHLAWHSRLARPPAARSGSQFHDRVPLGALYDRNGTQS